MEIKQFTEDYLADVFELHRELYKFHKPHSLMKFKFKKTDAQLDSEVIQHIQAGDNILLLMEKNTCIGFLRWSYTPASNGKVALPSIDWLYIKKEFRGHGGGTALLQEAIRHMRGLYPNAPGYVISVEYWNKSARRLYEKIGFQPQQLRLYFEA